MKLNKKQIEQLKAIAPQLVEIAGFGDEPMDGDDVVDFSEYISAVIDLNQGNMTQDEFDQFMEEL